MRYYVYALVDPTDGNRPRYIGKGQANRTEQHFRQRGLLEGARYVVGEETEFVLDEARRVEDTPGGEPSEKSRWLAGLLRQGCGHRDVARVVARHLDEDTAFTLESFLIEFVYGLDQLKNKAKGRHPERFRRKGEWDMLPALDLGRQTIAKPGPNPWPCYVYVLRDPDRSSSPGEGVFYVGKGQGDRLQDHFAAAERATADEPGTEKLDRIRELINKGHRPDSIGRVVARVSDEQQAFRLEALLIKFVYGFDSLSNERAGHHAWSIRPKEAWDALPEFDLPRILDPEARADRSVLRQMLLAERIGVPLEIVHARFRGRIAFGLPEVLDSGELGIEGEVGGTRLKVFTRRRKLQVELRPRDKAQRSWMQEHFQRLGAGHLLRRDCVFLPASWRGAAGMTTEIDVVCARVQLLVEIAGCEGLDRLSPAARDLLVEAGAGSTNTVLGERGGQEHSACESTRSDLDANVAPREREPDASVGHSADRHVADDNQPCDCDVMLAAVAALYPDVPFDTPSNRDSGERAMEGLVGAEGENVGTNIKVFCRKSGIGIELRPRSQSQRSWLLERLVALGCESHRALNGDGVLLPDAWKGKARLAKSVEEAARRVALLLLILGAPGRDDLDDDCAGLLT